MDDFSLKGGFELSPHAWSDKTPKKQTYKAKKKALIIIK